jgi:hypothetical protein
MDCYLQLATILPIKFFPFLKYFHDINILVQLYILKKVVCNRTESLRGLLSDHKSGYCHRTKRRYVYSKVEYSEFKICWYMLTLRYPLKRPKKLVSEWIILRANIIDRALCNVSYLKLLRGGGAFLARRLCWGFYTSTSLGINPVFVGRGQSLQRLEQLVSCVSGTRVTISSASSGSLPPSTSTAKAG